MNSRLIEVNSHGAGNCGFYAFANGLIPILQRDIITGNNTRWDKLTQFISELSKKNPAYAWETIKRDVSDFFSYSPAEKNSILDKFNFLLRQILVSEEIGSIFDALKKNAAATIEEKKKREEVEAKVEEKESKEQKKKELIKTSLPFIRYIENNHIISDVISIFNHYYDDDDDDKKDKAYDDSLKRDASDSVVKGIKAIVEKIKYIEEMQKEKMEEDRRINYLTLCLLYKEKIGEEEKEVETKAEEIEEKESKEKKEMMSSVLIKSLKEKLHNSKLATQSDLSILAAYFDVCLLTYKDKKETPEHPKFHDNRPSISVKNDRNEHWTTVFDFEDQNWLTCVLAEEKLLDQETVNLCRVLSVDNENSKLSAKAIRILADKKILVGEKIDCLASKDNCYAIMNLNQLNLLSKNSCTALTQNANLAANIEKLTSTQVTILQETLKNAKKIGIDFTDKLDKLFAESTFEKMKKCIQIACLEHRKKERDENQKARFHLFGGYTKTQKINAMNKLICHLQGEVVEFDKTDVGAIKNKRLFQLVTLLNIPIPKPSSSLNKVSKTV